MQVEDHEDVGDGGETVALSIHENTASFMDDFFKQVVFMTYWCSGYFSLLWLILKYHDHFVYCYFCLYMEIKWNYREQV